MAGDTVKVRDSGLKDLVEILQKGTNGISQVLNDLDRLLLVMRHQWTGQASSAYGQAQFEWQKTMQELREELAGHAASAEGARQAYGAASKRVAEIWTGKRA